MALECPNVFCPVTAHERKDISFVQKVLVVVVRETLAIMNCDFGCELVRAYPAIQQPGKRLNISTYLNHPWMPWTSSDSTLPRRKRDLREDLEVEGRVARVPIRSLATVNG